MAGHSTQKIPWRTAVTNAMRTAADEALVKRYGTLGVSFNYRWEHVSTVVRLALRLAELTDADRDIVEAAAWLHDIRKEVGEQHPEQGAAFTREFLPRTDFPPEKIERVAYAIEVHRGLWRDAPLDDLEARVLWDADKLSKIGLTAVFHWTGGSLAGFSPTTTSELIAQGRSATWQEKTVASMHTAPAQRAARRRLQSYNWLWDTLEVELRGDDLTGDDHN